MSSSSSLSSVALKFSTILAGVTDFGNTILSLWRQNEIHTWRKDTGVKLSWMLTDSTYCPLSTIPPSFYIQNFTNRNKTIKLTKDFYIESFLLCIHEYSKPKWLTVSFSLWTVTCAGDALCFEAISLIIGSSNRAGSFPMR